MSIQANALSIASMAFLFGVAIPSRFSSEMYEQSPGPQTDSLQDLEFVDFKELKLVSQAKPSRYPAEAKVRKVQGTVVVDFAIDESGKVYLAKAISGPPELHAASEQNALGMRFRPHAPAGTPMKVHSHLTNVWKLH